MIRKPQHKLLHSIYHDPAGKFTTSALWLSCYIFFFRRVRTAPGGKDSISALFGSEDVDQEAFRPTRKLVYDGVASNATKTLYDSVRQAPGGQDSIGGVSR